MLGHLPEPPTKWGGLRHKGGRPKAKTHSTNNKYPIAKHERDKVGQAKWNRGQRKTKTTISRKSPHLSQAAPTLPRQQTTRAKQARTQPRKDEDGMHTNVTSNRHKYYIDTIPDRSNWQREDKEAQSTNTHIHKHRRTHTRTTKVWPCTSYK